jgi:hypothetical protein
VTPPGCSVRARDRAKIPATFRRVRGRETAGGAVGRAEAGVGDSRARRPRGRRGGRALSPRVSARLRLGPPGRRGLGARSGPGPAAPGGGPLRLRARRISRPARGPPLLSRSPRAGTFRRGGEGARSQAREPRGPVARVAARSGLESDTGSGRPGGDRAPPRRKRSGLRTLRRGQAKSGGGAGRRPAAALGRRRRRSPSGGGRRAPVGRAAPRSGPDGRAGREGGSRPPRDRRPARARVGGRRKAGRHRGRRRVGGQGSGPACAGGDGVRRGRTAGVGGGRRPAPRAGRSARSGPACGGSPLPGPRGIARPAVGPSSRPARARPRPVGSAVPPRLGGASPIRRRGHEGRDPLGSSGPLAERGAARAAPRARGNLGTRPPPVLFAAGAIAFLGRAGLGGGR